MSLTSQRGKHLTVQAPHAARITLPLGVVHASRFTGTRIAERGGVHTTPPSASLGKCPVRVQLNPVSGTHG
ncbi:MAG: hypothetical protein HEQ38_19755 [Gemmatimonas sp.]|nr:hypothetical protein [Gemmatimonas sp.]